MSGNIGNIIAVINTHVSPIVCDDALRIIVSCCYGPQVRLTCKLLCHYYDSDHDTMRRRFERRLYQLTWLSWDSNAASFYKLIVRQGSLACIKYVAQYLEINEHMFYTGAARACFPEQDVYHNHIIEYLRDFENKHVKHADKHNLGGYFIDMWQLTPRSLKTNGGSTAILKNYMTIISQSLDGRSDQDIDDLLAKVRNNINARAYRAITNWLADYRWRQNRKITDLD